MPKPWAKYEIGYIDHDKFKALNANAICLWLEGKNYCDSRLTDGLIPSATARLFRFYSKRAVEMLTTSCGPKPGTEQLYSALWEPHAIGFKMHDYLEHNECREKALARITKRDAEDARKAANQKAWRERQKGVGAVTLPVTDPVTEVERSAALPHIQKTDNRNQISERTLSESARVVTDDDLGDRARELLEHYPVWYREERGGARLPQVFNSVQFTEALTICKTWDDDARIEKLARIVLSADDEFIARTDRGWKIFVLKAAWADDRLRQWEQQNQVAV